MPNCCDTPPISETEKKRLEMILFVKQKALNFKKMLEPFCESPELKEFLMKYDGDSIEQAVKENLQVFYSTGTLMVAREAIISKFGITDPVIQDKVHRYLECFCECILG